MGLIRRPKTDSRGIKKSQCTGSFLSVGPRPRGENRVCVFEGFDPLASQSTHFTDVKSRVLDFTFQNPAGFTD